MSCGTLQDDPRRLLPALDARHSPSPDMIETDQLTRCYGNLTAVDALSIRVEPGQVLVPTVPANPPRCA
jgi:hypothetical protein